jgi:hypothetical protein
MKQSLYVQFTCNAQKERLSLGEAGSVTRKIEGKFVVLYPIDMINLDLISQYSTQTVDSVLIIKDK